MHWDQAQHKEPMNSWEEYVLCHSQTTTRKLVPLPHVGPGAS